MIHLSSGLDADLILLIAFLKNPTDPTAGTTDNSSASSTVGNTNTNQTPNTATSVIHHPTLAPKPSEAALLAGINAFTPGMAGMATGLGGNTSSGPAFDANVNAMQLNNNPGGSYGDASYEVFDPLNWMLDGLVDFPGMGFTDLGGLEQASQSQYQG